MAKEMVDGREKMVVRKKQTATGLDGWVPICEKNLPYELTASFLLMAARPGVPLPIKLQEQHKALFPLDAPITEQSGLRLAQWAAGGTPPSAGADIPPATGQAASAPSETRSETLKRLCADAGANMIDLIAKAEVTHADEMSEADWNSAVRYLKKKAAAKAAV